MTRFFSGNTRRLCSGLMAALTISAPLQAEDAGGASPIPKARPGIIAIQAAKGPAPGRVSKTEEPEQISAVKRSSFVAQSPSRRSGSAKRSSAGSVCGDPAIKGTMISPIRSRVRGCGIAEPVRVTSISGVKFSQAATINCETARAIKAWVDNGLQPAFNKNPVVELKVAAHYVCRPRNNIRGRKISEHGKGNAIDISGFTLANGTQLSVLQHYRKTSVIKAAYRAACGTFGTTLGPGSDGHHEDHLHLDVANHRNGSHCR